MCVNNLPRVALDSGEAGIRTHDLTITSPVSQPLSHRATQLWINKSESKLLPLMLAQCFSSPTFIGSSIYFTNSFAGHFDAFQDLMLSYVNSILHQVVYGVSGIHL